MNLAQQAADMFGVTLTDEQIAHFKIYARELAAWNERVNLTAITEPEAVQVRHFLDSLSVAGYVQSGLRIIDVGTGAGFPGLALSIAYPETHITLLEATGKKIAFLNHIIQTLNQSNATVLHARAEEAGHINNHRARYDLVLARAVARLPALVEYMLPLAKIGGRCIAMKGESAQDEAGDAKRALLLLGGKLRGIEAVELPGIQDKHYLVVIEKNEPTPAPYPRRPGVPARKPL